MATREEQLDSLEKQLASLEDAVASFSKADDSDADDDNKKKDAADMDADAMKRSKATKTAKGAKAKAKKARTDAADDEDDDYSDLKDDADAEEDEGDGDDSVDKAATKKGAVKKGADETVVIDGKTIAKSDVGQNMFAIFKAQAARLQKAEEDIAKERDLRVTAEFKKRADDLYPHVPGSTDERADMLKAIDKMPEALKKSFEKVLESSERLAKSAFDTLGISGTSGATDVKKAAVDFNGKVAEIAKRDGISRSAAMSKARVEHPDLFKAYNDTSN